MPAMAIVLRVEDPAWLSRLKVGGEVRFIAERVEGALAHEATSRRDRAHRKGSPP
jgi:Cu/Ag efflux protein CusF